MFVCVCACVRVCVHTNPSIDNSQLHWERILQPWECRSVLQCVAVCCSVLQGVAGCCRVLQNVAECCSVLQCVAVCYCVLQCVAACCSVLQCVASRETLCCLSKPSSLPHGRDNSHVAWLIHLRTFTHLTQRVHLGAFIRVTWHSEWGSWAGTETYGVAPTSRLLKIVGLFCKRDL